MADAGAQFSSTKKSPALAVGLSALFPGLGHVYLGEKNTAAGLMGSSFGCLGGISYSAAHEKPLTTSLIAYQTVWSYSLYAAYRDVRQFNGNAGYAYKMPTDSFTDLSFAPFRWRVLKKPEVWGGFLGAVGLATATIYVSQYASAHIRASATDAGAMPSPALAFPIGLGEEALFRGYLQSQLIELCGPRGGIALTALAFGAMHIPNALNLEPEERLSYYAFSLPLITTLGAYFGWMTYKNGSLQESVALHSWYDFAVLAISALATQTASQIASTGSHQFALAIPF